MLPFTPSISSGSQSPIALTGGAAAPSGSSTGSTGIKFGSIVTGNGIGIWGAVAIVIIGGVYLWKHK